MKKILIFIALMIVALSIPFASFAETSIDTETSPEINPEGNSTPETESPSDGEILAPTTVEKIVEYVKANIEEIIVIAWAAFMSIYTKISNGKLGGTLGTLNGNAVQIAKSSVSIAENAAKKIDTATETIRSWETKIAAVLEKLERSEEEKRMLEETVSRIESVMKAVKGAAVEASNEVAELILLANLPNSVKDELYAKHLKSIEEIETKGDGADDGSKA